jgi:ABC-2 type transport system ATP-binding protein
LLLLEVNRLTSGYGSTEILHELSFEAKEPGIYVVLGPNGAGKTTLFRTIAGIIQPKAGDILLDGKSILVDKEVRKSINYLSHYNALPEEMTVHDSLEFYRRIDGGDVDRVMAALDLSVLRDKKVSDLSQGQKKRVSIAKVFLRDRGLYLLDEPTTALDPKVAREIRELVLGLSRDKVVLYSSHNLFEAREVGTYLILIKDGYLKIFDRITNVRPRRYRYGIRATSDLSKILNVNVTGGYYGVEVDSPEEAGKLLKSLVEKGVTVTEMRELDNPLEELFDQE